MNLQVNRYDNLQIDLTTKSGDKINFLFEQANSKKIDLNDFKTEFDLKLSQFSFSFESSNGIDDNDKKEIDKIMEEAEPYINTFLNKFFSGTDNNKTKEILNKISDFFVFENKKFNSVDLKDSFTKKISEKLNDIDFNSFNNINKDNIGDFFDKLLSDISEMMKKFDLSFEELQNQNNIEKYFNGNIKDISAYFQQNNNDKKVLT